MKETTKKNMPFIIAVLIVGAIILTVVIGVLIGKLRADYKGFAAEMQTVCNTYHIERVVPSEPQDIAYEIHVNPDMWRGFNQNQKETYCSKVYILTQSAAWDHKIFNETTQPILWFYVDGIKVAGGSAGKIDFY